MVRVLVNGLPLRRGGGVTYLQQQLAALARLRPEWDLHTLISPWGIIDAVPGSTIETIQVRSLPARLAYEQIRLPWRRADILYCPANFGPAFSGAPTVLAIHDAHYYKAGLQLDATKSRRQRARIAANHLAMKRADAVVAVSQTLADDAAATIPQVADRIHVLPCAAPTWPIAAVPVGGIPSEYILTVGSSASHKCLGDVVAGWARSIDHREAPISLVVAGAVSDVQIAEHRQIAGRHRRSLIHLGGIWDRGKLKWLYQHAIALVSLSALESLSLTPIEASSLGCPVVLSDIPAHRESMQGYGSFVPPGDSARLAQTLNTQVYGQQLSREARSWPTTWEDNASTLCEIFEAVQRRTRLKIGRSFYGSRN